MFCSRWTRNRPRQLPSSSTFFCRSTAFLVVWTVANLSLSEYLVERSPKVDGDSQKPGTTTRASGRLATTRVVIVGAGAAGLTAAKTLKQHGYHDVRILESSTVFGGRVRRTDSFADYPIDLGPSWVHHPDWLPQINGGTLDNVPTAPFRDPSGILHGHFFTNNYSWYDFFANYMAPDPDSIVYSCQVDRIKYKISEVQVSCGKRNFLADHAIVTASLAVLKGGDITFEPPLPNHIIDAHPAKMWAGVKAIIEFSNRFYPISFLYNKRDDDSEVAFWDSSVANNSSQHILVGYFVGRAALPFIDTDNEHILRNTLKWLDGHFNSNDATKYYKKHVVINWSKEPFIRGTYSSCAPNFTMGGAQNVQGIVYLAGEAFPCQGQKNGWVHSAALSGRHAAMNIIDISDEPTWAPVPTFEPTYEPTGEPILQVA